MTIFARWGNRVLYVDPPVTFLSPFKNPSLRGQAVDRLCQADERIYVYTPPVILPLGNIYRSINRLNQGILSSGLRRIYGKLGFMPTLCWTYLPNTVDMGFPGKPFLVYDCADEHAAFPGLIRKETVHRMERELFRRAGLSLTSAGELFQRKKELAPDLLVVPNGAAVEHFRRARDPGLSVPSDLAFLPRPVIGYIGAVSPWLDQDLLAEAARAHPDWTLVIIGPADTDTSALAAFPNIHLLGHRDYRLLPSYLKGFDATVIPFRINELTRGVNPVKLYEYLAAGKPVVSTGLPEVRAFGEVVSLAGTPSEFVQRLEEELASDSPEKVAARLRIAREHSWEARAGAVSEQIRLHRERAYGNSDRAQN
ncbi:MAG: putative teichuronic acid biosynthesis glycosyltransferase TuaH [Firmicutes bacterium ADurb.Bin456]|nr:MAG: putative teichuronic acid biosynthesis glycosyltransferase TuaH [Firmicutes bacterium ADurb.Bin456]